MKEQLWGKILMVLAMTLYSSPLHVQPTSTKWMPLHATGDTSAPTNMPQTENHNDYVAKSTEINIIQSLKHCYNSRACRSKTQELVAEAEESNQLTVSVALTALNNCRSCSDWKTALKIYLVLKNEGIRSRKGGHRVYEIPGIIYGQTAITLARGGAEAQTYQLFAEMLSAGEIPSLQTIDNVALDLSKQGAYQAISGIFDQLRSFQMSTRISDRAYNALLNACSKAKAYEACLKSYDKFMLNQGRLDSIGLSVLIKACSELSLPQRAIDLIYSECNRSLISPSLLERTLALCAKSQLVEQSLRTLVDYERGLWHQGQNCEESFTADLESTVGVEGSLSSVLDELVSIESEPAGSARMYAGVIMLLAEGGETLMARAVLKSFIARGGEATEAMYTSLIYSNRLTNDFHTAAAIFTEMCQEAIPVTIAAYNALLNVYVKAGVFEKDGMGLLDSMTASSIKWDHRTYATVMKGFKKDSSKVLALWHEYRTSECSAINKAMVMTVLEACAADGAGLQGLSVISEVVSRSKKVKGQSDTSLPDVAMYNLVLRALKLDPKAQSRHVTQVVDSMRSRLPEQNEYVVQSAMEAFETKGDWRQSTLLVLQMLKGAEELTGNVSNAALAAMKACLKASPSQSVIVERLITQLPVLRTALQHDTIMASEVLHAAVQSRNATSLKALMNVFQNENIAVTTKALTAVVNVLDEIEEYEEAVKVFESTIAQHIHPKHYSHEACSQSRDDAMYVDLHGYSVAVAKAAVRSALGILRRMDKPLNLVLITGRGKKSSKSNHERLDPVLKPSVQRWLSSSEPPLTPAELVGNTGRLIVSNELIETWASSVPSGFKS